MRIHDGYAITEWAARYAYILHSASIHTHACTLAHAYIRASNHPPASMHEYKTDFTNTMVRVHLYIIILSYIHTELQH